MEINNEIELPIYIGELLKAFGIKGFHTAEIGHPVFEFKDRYIIYLNNERDEKNTVIIPFYKESLKHHIDYKKL